MQQGSAIQFTTPVRVLREAIFRGRKWKGSRSLSVIVLGCGDQHNSSEGMFEIPSSCRVVWIMSAGVAAWQ